MTIVALWRPLEVARESEHPKYEDPFEHQPRNAVRAGFRPQSCQWIMETKTTAMRSRRRRNAEEIDAHKCGGRVVNGKSYCPTHLEQAVWRLDPVTAMRAADRLVARLGIKW